MERTFRERDSRWHDLEAGVSLACPGKEGHVAGVLWAKGEGRDGNEVREVGRAECMRCQWKGSA